MTIKCIGGINQPKHGRYISSMHEHETHIVCEQVAAHDNPLDNFYCCDCQPEFCLKRKINY